MNEAHVYHMLLSSLAMLYLMAQVAFCDCCIFDQLQVRSFCIVGRFMIYRWSRWFVFVSLVVSMIVSLIVSGVSFVRSVSGQLRDNI